jgi:hypothetical protein
VKATGVRPKIIVSTGRRGVVGHAGARLLADVIEVTGLTGARSDAPAGLRQRRGVHDLGRVAVDLAVLRDQSELFGPVASAWWLLSIMDPDVLSRLATARAAARKPLGRNGSSRTAGTPGMTAAGLPVPGLSLAALPRPAG